MIIINILGGGTAPNLTLTLYSDNYKATSIYDKDCKLEIKVESHGLTNKNKYMKISFIRGLYIYIFENVTTSGNIRKIKLNLLDLISIAIYILDKLYFKISLMDYVYVLFTIMCCVIALIDTRMIEVHGAEHMIANYYDKNHKVNLSDMSEIRKASIMHKRCSTNFYGIKLAILFLLKIFINDFMIRFILMISFEYEIIKNKDNKIIYCLSYPLYSVGMLIQRIFFVRQPKDKDIEQAIRTVQELEKYENKDKDTVYKGI